ncbi:MAG: ribosomal RNA small subunit methyltransferase A [Candidatus Kerfeldbacteria bacterium]|nr:ribosomal RNA small subunit methyltransferase A [Candidatus Kerfeldbacteria bacterium]
MLLYPTSFMIQHSILPVDLRAWTQTLVKQLGLRAGRRLGQHFLVNRGVLQDIIRVAHPTSAVPVLEVGGGLGVLTLALLEQGVRVSVVELDSHLAQALRKLAVVGSNLQVVEGDILKLSDYELQQSLGLAPGQTFDIVANLPYEISGVFLRRFLSGVFRPRQMVLLLQREVGERLVARPGQMSLLSLLARLSATDLQLVRLVPASAFWPAPRVQSCLIKIKLRGQVEQAALIDAKEAKQLWRLARLGFAARRKLLLNNLSGGLHVPRDVIAPILVKVGLKSTARAQELSLEQWIALVRELESRIENRE